MQKFQSQKYMDLLAMSNKHINLKSNHSAFQESQGGLKKRPSIGGMGDTGEDFFKTPNTNTIKTPYEKYMECEEILKAMCE